MKKKNLYKFKDERYFAHCSTKNKTSSFSGSVNMTKNSFFKKTFNLCKFEYYAKIKS